MKTISIFVHSYPPAKGGLENLCSHIKNILSSRYRVHVFTGQGLSLDSYKTFTNYTQKKLPEVHRLELNEPKQRLTNKLLSRVIFKFPFFSPFYFGPILDYSEKHLDLIKKSDLVIGMGLPTNSVLDAHRFAKKYNKPLLALPAYHNRDYYNNCHFFQKIFDYSSGIICLTKQERRDLCSNYKINRDKTDILYFSPFTQDQSQKQIQKEKKNIQDKINHFRKKNITIGYIGQISNRKNLFLVKDFLDQHLKAFESRGIKLSFLFAGAKTNDSKSIENLFSDYLKNKNLKIIYDFKNSQKGKIYQKIDIFLNPSVEESLGIVNFEAIFYSLPLLIHKDSAFSELIENKKTGLLFSHPDQIAKSINGFLKNPLSIKKLTGNQYKVLANINYDTFQKQLLSMVKSHLQQ